MNPNQIDELKTAFELVKKVKPQVLHLAGKISARDTYPYTLTLNRNQNYEEQYKIFVKRLSDYNFRFEILRTEEWESPHGSHSEYISYEGLVHLT